MRRTIGFGSVSAIISGHQYAGAVSYTHLSERTVKNHVSNIFKKIEVTDRTQAAVFAIRNNLIEL